MILNQLKAATGSRHAALEARLPLLDASMSQATYRQFLRRFLGYYEPLEARLGALPYWDRFGFDYAARLKTPHLLQDLQALGDTPAAIAAIDRCDQLPPLSSPEQLLGCLYVIEGATLGGQIISRHLAANLGLTPVTGSAFFGGYGGRTGNYWKTFCAMLRSNTSQNGHHSAILASANQTFETLGEWLFPAVPTPTGTTL